MARRKKRSASPGSGGGLLGFVLLVLLVVVVFLAYRFWKQQQGLPVATRPGATQEASLVSDNGILFGGMPRARDGEASFEVLKNDAYIVGYSEKRRDPLWAAYRVIHVDHPFHLERPKGEFLTDTRTQARVKHHDFTGYGFDRGHMAPNSAIARCFGEEAQRQTFLLSNICPQSSALNEKVWEKLEADELAYADDFGQVWVMDGPIFADLNGGATRKLATGIAVPTAFYKILIEDHAGAPRVFSVIMPQTVRGTEMPQQFLTSIRKIEDATHLEFLWKLPPEERAALEDRVWPMWDR